jgi:hypothetical protein
MCVSVSALEQTVSQRLQYLILMRFADDKPAKRLMNDERVNIVQLMQ